MPSNTGLNELIIALQDAADAITNNPTLDPLSPEGQKLQKTARDITDCAVTIGGLALDALQPELKAAIEKSYEQYRCRLRHACADRQCA